MGEDWTAWIERYRAHLELEGLAPRTIQGRPWLLSKFVSWCRELGIEGPARLTPELLADYRRFRIERVNAKGRRDRIRTVNSHLLALRRFFQHLSSRGVVPQALLAPLSAMKEPRLLPRETLLHAEILKMLAAVPGNTPVHLRDRAMIETLYSTGMRREELINLKLSDLDLEGGAIRIEQGKGSKDRMVPVGRHAAQWIDRYLRSARPALLGRGEDHGRVFVSKSGRPLTGTSVREAVRRWAAAAGIEKPVGPQALRRSCATEMIRNGANPAHVRDLLGHEDFASLQSYVKLAIVDLKDALARHHPRERGI